MSKKSKAKNHSLPATTITKPSKKKLNKTSNDKTRSIPQPRPHNLNTIPPSNHKSSNHQPQPFQSKPTKTKKKKSKSPALDSTKPQSSAQSGVTYPNSINAQPSSSSTPSTKNSHKSKLKSASKPPSTSQPLTHDPSLTEIPRVKSSSSTKNKSNRSSITTENHANILNSSHGSTVPQQTPSSTRKRKRKQLQQPPHSDSLPLPNQSPKPLSASSAPFTPSLINTTEKNKKSRKNHTVTPSPQPSLPNSSPLTPDNNRDSRTTPTTVPSTPTSPRSSPASPSLEITKRRKRAREHPQPSIPHNYVSENHKSLPNAMRENTNNRSQVTSSVPSKPANLESDTGTKPPVHQTNSPYPSPRSTSSQRYTSQSHPRRITNPAPHLASPNDDRNRSHPRVDLEHASIENHSNMNRNHGTWFHVGTNRQQPHSRIPQRRHTGIPSHRVTSALDPTYPSAGKRKRNFADVRNDHFPNPNVPDPRSSGYFSGFQQQPARRNVQLYPVQGNDSARYPYRTQEYPQRANLNRSIGPKDSVNPQLGPSNRNVTQHHAYRGDSQYVPSQHRREAQQPSQNPDAMQIDRPERGTNLSNSTPSKARNSSEPATSRQPRTTPLDQSNQQTAGKANTRNGQGQRSGANATSQRTAGQPSSSMRAGNKLQKKVASPTGEYYGIRCGRDGFSGVATCWQSCSVFVVGYRDAVYELFDTWEKAERFSDRYGTGASITHRSNFRHFFGCRRNGVIHKGSADQLPWEHENEPQVVSLVVGAACLRFGIGSGIGGYGVFLSLNNPYNCAGLMEGNVTEMRLQLKGLLEALEIVHQHQLVKDGGTVELYTASQEVKNGIDHWLGRWDRSGQWMRDGKPVRSQDLWRAILNIRKELLKKGTKIHTIWIRRPNRVPALQEAVNLARVVFSNETRDEGQKRAQL